MTTGAINPPCHQRSDETLIADDGWATRHGAAIGDAHRDAPFTPAIAPLLAVVTDCRWERLAPLLGAERRPLRASELGIGDSGTARRRAIRRAPGPEAPAHANRRMPPWRDVVARQAYAPDGAR